MSDVPYCGRSYISSIDPPAEVCARAVGWPSEWFTLVNDRVDCFWVQQNQIQTLFSDQVQRSSIYYT